MSITMRKVGSGCSIQLIDGASTFNASGLENFTREVELSECGIQYAVVSIMGPQSSGKSTLLNHLFHTNFKEMNATIGRSQTTEGIWMARCAGIKPCTIVMDLEGTDGRERGEDDTTFEKRSALFALAVSDVMLINMWCHDLGRNNASNMPLLENIFQVMMRLLGLRKTTLMFVLRDKTTTPFECLERDIKKDIEKIWDSVPKPESHKETPLNEFFNVQVVALSSYEGNKEQFMKQVASLRKRFNQSTEPGGLAGDRSVVVDASGFSFSLQRIWTVIKENKDLDLPAHKVLVATVRCEEIANEKYSSFIANKDWSEVQEVVQSHHVPGFGGKLSSILGTCLSEYDAETTYFEEGVRSTKRKQLEDKLLQLVQPAYQSMLGHIRSRTLDKFKSEFVNVLKGVKGFAEARDLIKSSMNLFDEESTDAIIKQANWQSTKVRDKLQRDIDEYVAEVRTSKLSKLSAPYKQKLCEELSGPVKLLLDGASDDTWPAIRGLLQRESQIAKSGFSSALSGFGMDEKDTDNTLSSLEDYARGIVERKAKEEAESVMILMNDRFTKQFSQKTFSLLGVFRGKEDIPAIAKRARSASLKVLSVMAAIRLDNNTDNIEKILSLALVDTDSGSSATTSSLDALDSSTWEEIPAAKTLITPLRCIQLWNEFMRKTDVTVTEAIAAQKERRIFDFKLGWGWGVTFHNMHKGA